MGWLVKFELKWVCHWHSLCLLCRAPHVHSVCFHQFHSLYRPLFSSLHHVTMVLKVFFGIVGIVLSSGFLFHLAEVVSWSVAKPVQEF